MTYTEALEMIKIHGEYYTDFGNTFKRKVIPLNTDDIHKYMCDILVNRLIISNEDVKNYSSNNKFSIMGFDIRFINES